MTDAAKTLFGEIAKPDAGEIFRIPTVFMGQISPFAGHRAGGAIERSRSLPCQKVREIEEVLCPDIDVRPVFAEPQQFRRLHFRGNTAADIFQHGVFAGIDALRLFDGAVIHPDDDIPLGMIGRANRQGLIFRSTHHQRAGGIETDTGDLGGIDAGAGNAFPDAVANGLPYFAARLFGNAAILAMHADRAFGGGEKLSCDIEDTGARRAGPDIDANQIGSHLRYSSERIIRCLNRVERRDRCRSFRRSGDF